ncbi:MAG: HEAT repeat domain-containing protein [Treponema sp.]|nr:HEAT repeat domain-containing protein [Treponema sp.]
MRILPLFLALLVAPYFSPLAWAGEGSPPPERTVDERRLDILRFGTETEVANLIQTLRSENDTSFDGELIDIAGNTRNRSILTGLFVFFGEAERPGLEDRAIRAVVERDYETNEVVLAAIDYLGWLGVAQSIDALKELINSRETRFLNNAIRALGRAARGGERELPPQASGDDVLAEGEEYAGGEHTGAGYAEGAGGDDVLAEGAEYAGDDAGYVAGGHTAVEHSGREQSDLAALFLLDYFNNRSPANETQREIVVALGETRSREGVSFLIDIIRNETERTVLRMSALDAIATIGAQEGMDAVIEAVSTADPSVRSSAVAALGPFSGEEVERAILDAFRDSYFRTRLGASRAAGQRQQASAVPFLRFRAENDEAVAVREAAIRALGAINNDEAMSVLDSLFSNRRNSDGVRVLAADMLLRNDADTYSTRVVVELDYANSRRQTALYNGFIRALTTARSDSLEGLARRFITGGGVIETALALELILNNEFLHLADDVRELLDERRSGAGLARRARITLERLGLEVEVDT